METLLNFLLCCIVFAIAFVWYTRQQSTTELKRHEQQYRLEKERLQSEERIIALKKAIAEEETKRELEKQKTEQLRDTERQHSERCKVENNTKLKEIEKRSEKEIAEVKAKTEEIKVQCEKYIHDQKTKTELDIAVKKEETQRTKEETTKEIELAKQRVEENKEKWQSELNKYTEEQSNLTKRLENEIEAKKIDAERKHKSLLATLETFERNNAKVLAARSDETARFYNRQKDIMAQSNKEESGGWFKAKKTTYSIKTSELQTATNTYEKNVLEVGQKVLAIMGDENEPKK